MHPYYHFVKIHLALSRAPFRARITGFTTCICPAFYAVILLINILNTEKNEQLVKFTKATKYTFNRN